MRFKVLALMALAFASMDARTKEAVQETNSFKKSFQGTMFENVNVGNNPIYHQTRSQKIKRKRFLASKR